MDAWGTVAKYLNTANLGKASLISKGVRVQVINSPAFRAALSRHRLGRQYDGGDKHEQSEYVEEDEDCEEEMEEEYADEVDSSPNMSPNLKMYPIPQT